MRLLRHAGLEVGIRALQPLGGHPGDGLDLALELLVDVEADPERLRDELDRPVVVSRAEPTRDEAGVGGECLPQRGLQLLGPVPDDCDPCGLEAEPERLTGEEGTVQIGPLAAHELAPRRDDDSARPLQPPARAVRDGVTMTFRLARAGSDTALPSSLSSSRRGCWIQIQKRLPGR